MTARGELFADTAYVFDDQSRFELRKVRATFNTSTGTKDGVMSADPRVVPEARRLLFCSGKVGQLAKRVGMERTHLYRKLKQLGAGADVKPVVWVGPEAQLIQQNAFKNAVTGGWRASRPCRPCHG